VEESKKDFRIDIAEASEALGPDVCLFGNLDAIGLLEHGSDDDLRREVQRQMDVGRRRRGRFVLSIGSPVTPGTSVQRVRRYAALAHEYGS
jgi:uroporphyrinogen-III decarboxylase